ncbi:MAG: M20 family metallopeptidase [Desulfurococcaceae archaeon]
MLNEDLFELAVKILSESIKYRTILGEDYENIVDFYKDVLSSYGVHVTIHRVPDEYVEKNLPVHYNPSKPRFILIARVGSGDKVLQFNGHYDVVPPGDGWKTNPFEPVIIENKLYGRGSSDMKGGIAAFLAAMIYYAQKEPNIVVEGVLVPDEEIGGLTGTGYLVRELGSRPDWVVIAEPSGISNVYIGHRGNVWFMVKVYGKQAHGSSPWLGDNAFEKMLIYAKTFIDEYRAKINSKRSSFIYEHPEASKPTITPGGLLLSPGAVNVVPGMVGFSVDRRLIIEENIEGVISEVKDLVSEINNKTGIYSEVEILDASNPAYTPPDSIIVKSIELSIRNVLGTKPSLIICTGGLDLKYYSEKKIEAIAYGPGAIGIAHKPNEYIDLLDLKKSISVYIELVKNLELRTL